MNEINEIKKINEIEESEKIDEKKNKSFFKTYGSLITFFLVTFITFISVTLLITFISQKTILNEVLKNNLYFELIITVLITYLVGVFLPSYIYKKIRKIDISYKISFKNIILCILLGIMVQPIGMTLSLLGSIFVNSNVVTDTVEVYKTLNPYFILFFFAVLPAIVEEYMFRGVMLNDTKTKDSFLRASIITSICFGIMHLNIQQFIYAVALGIFFCYVYKKTSSLLSTMIMHFTINGSQLLLSLKLFTSNAYDATTQTKLSIGDTLTAFGIMCITVVPIFVAICTLLYKSLDNPNKQE